MEDIHNLYSPAVEDIHYTQVNPPKLYETRGREPLTGSLANWPAFYEDIPRARERTDIPESWNQSRPQGAKDPHNEFTASFDEYALMWGDFERIRWTVRRSQLSLDRTSDAWKEVEPLWNNVKLLIEALSKHPYVDYRVRLVIRHPERMQQYKDAVLAMIPY